MVPSKLLIGSVVGVGSVSTAAVVAHQQGFFSLPGSQTQSSDNTANTGTPNNSGSESTISQPATTDPETPPAKPNQKAVEDWLNGNRGEENWKIQIKKSGETQVKDFKESSISEEDLKDLKDYLDSDANKELLKSLFSAVESKTLTFEKTGNNWKHILTKEDIKKWVDKTSENKATLKLADENGAKELTGTEDLNKLLKDLFDGKSAFKGITVGQPPTTKNILFEKVGDDWKHSKTEIKNWLSTDATNKFTIQIKTTVDTVLDNEKEENLIGLLKYLKDNKNTLTNLIKDKNPTSLTFKKESTNWDVVHSETTINNWVGNTFNNATLKIEDNGAPKQLSEITTELKQLFETLKSNKESFTSLTSSDVLVFEKKGSDWKHIKTALTDLLNTTKGKANLTIKISKDGTTTTDLSNAKDEDLIGLYKCIDDSTDLNETDGVGFLVFKKTDSTWARDKTQEKNSK